MKVTVKAVFNSSKDNWESFGNNRYLLKVISYEDVGAKNVIIAHISRYLGVPPSKIAFLGKDMRENWLFEIL